MDFMARRDNRPRVHPRLTGRTSVGNAPTFMRGWLIFLVILITAGVAGADQATAKKAHEKGVVAFNLQRYDDALAMFQRAYEEMQDPSFLYNIGQTQRLLGRYAEAGRSYHVYLAQAEVTDAQRERVKKLIAEVEQAAKQQGAQEQHLGTKEPAPPPEAREAHGSLGRADAARPSRLRNVTAWSVLGAGIIIAAVGAGVLGAGHASHNDARIASSLQRQQDLLDQSHSEEVAGYTLLGVGGAAAVTGVGLFFITPGRSHAAVSFAPSTSRLVGVGGNF